MWLIVSSLSPHSLYLLLCCVLSILAFIWLVLTALFWAAIRRDSVSLLKFLFLRHIQGFSCDMLFISRLKRHRVVFLPIFVSEFLAFCCPSCNQYRSWLLQWVLHRIFVYSLRVVVSMRQRCLQCWQVLFLPLFLKHIVCQRRLGDVMPNALSLVFLFFGPLI